MKMYKVQNNKLKFGRHDNLNSGQVLVEVATMPPPSCQDVGIKDQEELRLGSPGQPRRFWLNPLVILEEIRTWYKDTGLQNLCITAPLF